MHRVQVPHPPSAGAEGGSRAVVRIRPMKKKLPRRESISSVFFPNQPSPASRA